MFYVVWIVVATLTLVPLSVASLRGWSPAWLARPAPRKVTKARGIAALAIYGSALTPAVLGLLGFSGDELLMLRILLGPVLIVGALLLVGWATVQERHSRRTR